MLFSLRTFRAGALSEQIGEHDLQAITVLSERRASQDASLCSSSSSLCSSDNLYVFMSSVFTKGCALTFSQGVFVHKNTQVTFEVTMATKFPCLSSSCASCHVTSVGCTTLLNNFYTTVQVKGSYFTEHQIGFLFERRIFHDSSTLFL